MHGYSKSGCKDDTVYYSTTESPPSPEVGPTPNNKSDIEKKTPSSTTTDGEKYCVRSKYEKAFIISFTSLGMIICMIATNIYLPAMPLLEAEYKVTPTMINLTITVFMIVQGISPALMSSISDFQGRRLAWILALSSYLIANIALAVQHSYVALIILRCLQSVGSSCAIPFGFAVVSDISAPSERGKYVGPMNGFVMGAFAFGPAIGGLMADRFGWRSIFWLLAIAGGSFLVGYIAVVPETARTVVGNGSVEPKDWWRRSIVQNLKTRPEAKQDVSSESIKENGSGESSVLRVFGAFLLLKEIDALILIVYTSLLYSGISALWATTSNHFGSLYGLNIVYVGLCFLPFGITGGIGSFIAGKLMDFNYRRTSKGQTREGNKNQEKTADFPIEAVRLQVALPAMLVVSCVFIAYGWVVERELPLAVPLVFQASMGLFGTSLLGVVYTLLIDLFPGQAAATSGAADFIRCWMGAVTAAVIDSMLSSMGWGWCFTLIGLLMLLALPSIGLVYLYGPRWRKSREDDVKRKENM